MTITLQPAAKTVLACRADPNLWLSDEAVDQALAAHICKTHCPFIDECLAFPPTADTVQAGVAYGHYGHPAKQQPKPDPTNCPHCVSAPVRATSQFDDCGSHAAYRRHKRRGEDACEPCTAAYRAAERERAALRRKPAANRCGTVAGLRRHREDGEPPCEVCLQGQREASEKARIAHMGDDATRQARADTVRELAALGLSDGQIGARLGMSGRRIRHLRAAHQIPAGRPVPACGRAA